MRRVLRTDDAYRVLSIPITKLVLSDVMVWRHDGSSDYTVKSGYIRLMIDITTRQPDLYTKTH